MEYEQIFISKYLEMLNRTENSILHEKISKLMLEKAELEQEIKKLKSDLSLVIKERDDNIKQNKKLREVNSYRAKVVDITPQDEKSVAEETIQDLLKRIKELNEELDYVRSIKDSAESTIKTQDERIRFLEQCLDNKEKVNKSLREENKRLSDFLECEA